MRKTLAVGTVIFLVVALMSVYVWFVIDDINKPVVYKSVSTGKIVRVEVNGRKIPHPEDFKGTSYHLEWEK